MRQCYDLNTLSENINLKNTPTTPDLLHTAGLQLFSVFDMDVLPDEIIGVLSQISRFDRVGFRLVLVGNYGPTLWRKIQEFGMATGDPADHYSRVMVENWLHKEIGNPDWVLLYPGDYPIPLQKLGKLAGWCGESQLGVGIHPRYGTWFAYRIALMVKADLKPTTLPAGITSPCEKCEAKPCVTACPVNAVKSDGLLDISGCLKQRLQPGSDCALTCGARTACPVGADYRYSADQIRYHYQRSLDSIRKVSG